VVTVSSVAHRLVRSVPLTDPRTDEGHYRKWRAYGHSKLANLLFAFELDRRARAAGLPITSVAAHPGLAATNLVSSGMNMGRTTADGAIGIAVSRLLGQSSRDGALPLLMAATMPDLPGASYLGPSGPGELRGAPGFVTASGPARDEEMAAQFWETSEKATGVTYP
jgi:NAD(P)-dependent dehydrogenase (short-subunit alcohol dehydrogenase family)